MEECYRVLKPGGILRVVVPDLETIARLYIQSLEHALAGADEWSHHYQWILLEMYDQVVRTVSGGAMADYFRQDAILNEDFVVGRLGLEAENLIRSLRGTSPPTKGMPSSLSEREAMLYNLLGDYDYEALQIGRFRQSGEIHQWMYDRYSLKMLLEQVGFERVAVCQHDESAIPHFHEFFLDTRPDGRVRKPDSLFMEAQKASVPETEKPQASASAQFSLKQTLLPRAEPKNLEDLPQVQQLQQRVQHQEDQITVLQQQVAELKGNLEKSRKRTRCLNSELEQVQELVAAMERSPFWKARTYWKRLKHILRAK